MSTKSRIAMLLGAMEEVFLAHVDTLSTIESMLEEMTEEEKQEMHWGLGWNMARMQESLMQAAGSLCRAIEDAGFEPPALDLEIPRPDDDPEEFLRFWGKHLSSQAALIHLSYQDLQKSVLQNPEEETDDSWDEGLEELLRRDRE